MTMTEIIERTNDRLAAVLQGPGEPGDEVAVSVILREMLWEALAEDHDLDTVARQWAEDWNMHVGEADLATITLLDVQPGGSYTGSEGVGAKLCVGTWTAAGYKGFVGTYPELTVLWGAKEGEPPARILDRKFGLWTAVIGALKVQETQGMTVVDRWLSTPEYFRLAHPICPQCGASAVGRKTCGTGGTFLGCEICGWHAENQGLSSEKELAKIHAFKAELEAVHKARDAETTLQCAIDKLTKEAEALPQLVETYRQYRLPSGDLTRAMQAINTAVGHSVSLMRGLYHVPPPDEEGVGDELKN